MSDSEQETCPELGRRDQAINNPLPRGKTPLEGAMRDTEQVDNKMDSRLLTSGMTKAADSFTPLVFRTL